MKYSRFVKPAAGLLVVVLALAPSWSVAQDFPSKPVVLYSPYQAGGMVDVIARPLAAKLSKMWGQPVVVENRPGANGVIATQALMKATPDGHTLLYHLTGMVQNPLLNKNVTYDPVRDVQPVAQIGAQAMGLVVPVKRPVRSLSELVADGKKKSGTGHSYGSVGIGHTGHIWSELLTAEAGFQGTNVVYKGASPLMVDLMSDRMDWAFLASSDAVDRSQSGSLRVLAVTGPARMKQLPETPTLGELGFKGFEMVGWHGVFAPARTPTATVAKIERDVLAALKDPEIQKIMDNLVITPTGLGASQFAQVLRQDQANWAELIKRFKIQVE